MSKDSCSGALPDVQVEAFLTDVVKEPVYLLGNSLGGYLAVSLAARRPDLVKGVCLVNGERAGAARLRSGAQFYFPLWNTILNRS